MFTRLASFCRKLLSRESEAAPSEHEQPHFNQITILPREQHIISRKNISINALKVLSRLNKCGFDAYLVGGGVRDLLLGMTPKDFDITTNATPEQIRTLFRNCRLIGRRFRLAHIMFGQEIIEVATFRGHHDVDTFSSPESGMLLRDNVYGSIEEDAQRRDFTINSLYYNAADFSVRDYTGGLHDLKQGTIRLIGDPETRYREDPVRMLRAARFAAKLNMEIDTHTAAPIPQLAGLLRSVPTARLFEESLKLLQSGYGYQSYLKLREYQLFITLFPIIERHFTATGDSFMEKIIEQVLKNTDRRLKTGLRVNPAFLFATMLWYPMMERAQQLTQESGLSYFDAFALANDDILNDQCRTLAIPRRLTSLTRDIWQLQLRLPRRQGQRAYRLMEQPKFRAAYDLLELRAQTENRHDLTKLAKWWEEFQTASSSQQKNMLSELDDETPFRRQRRPRRASSTTKKRT